MVCSDGVEYLGGGICGSTQHIEMDQLGQKFKIYSVLYPKWLFFQFYFFFAKKKKKIEIGHCILKI